jgi:hypothetical protein
MIAANFVDRCNRRFASTRWQPVDSINPANSFKSKALADRNISADG